MLNDNTIEIATFRKLTKPKIFRQLLKVMVSGRALCRHDFYRLEMELTVFDS